MLTPSKLVIIYSKCITESAGIRYVDCPALLIFKYIRKFGMLT